MRSEWRWPFLVALVGTAVGCAPSAVAPETPASRPKADRTPGVTASSPVKAGEPQAPAVAGAYFGRVLSEDGQPVSGIRVRGFLVSDAGASIISNNGGAAVSNNGGAAVSNNGGAYRLRDVGLETRTDAQGRFELKDPQQRPLNLEADSGDTLKAIRFNVPATASGIDLKLAPTGSLRGKVTAPTAKDVTDFEGVDVFVPGTAYLAKADKAGSYTIPNMAPAAYELVASRTGLGRARVAGVQVASKETATAPDLAMVPSVPVIAAIEPSVAAAGATVTLRGERFGASAAKTFTVSVAGVQAAEPKRLDDRTIQFKVPAVPASGDIVVTVSGLPSAGVPFVVLKTLAIDQAMTELLNGETRSFPLAATDMGGKAVADVKATWSVAGDALTVDAATGSVTAARPGTATLKAAVGDLTATLDLRVVPLLATVTTIAGAAEAGDLDGPAASARFRSASGLAPDGAGGLLVLDGYKLRRIELAAGGPTVSTLAGGPQGFADGPGASAQFNLPTFAAVREGQAWITDFGNGRVRKVALADAAHTVSTVAGTGVFGRDDGPALAARFGALTGVAVGADGTVYVVDADHHRIRAITPAGEVVTVAGGGDGAGPTAGAFADGPALSARFAGPRDLAIDTAASPPALYVADPGNLRIRKVVLAPGGATVETVAGKGQEGELDGLATEAAFRRPWAIALDGQGRLFVADESPTSQTIRLVDLKAAGRPVSTIAGGPLGYVDGSGRDARFMGLADLAAGDDGALYLADIAANRVRKLTIRTAP